MSDIDLPDDIPTQGEIDTVSPTDVKAIPPSGGRFALRNVRKQLTDDELAQTGTQKMLLDMLEEAENEKENYKSYIINFHEADKKCAILGEKLNADKSNEIYFGSGVGLGGAILGLSPFFWDKGIIYGVICLIIGLGLIIAVSIGRAVKR